MVQLLVQERLSAALTQRELAKRLKKPHSYVSKIEVCERRIDLMALIPEAKPINWPLFACDEKKSDQVC